MASLSDVRVKRKTSWSTIYCCMVIGRPAHSLTPHLVLPITFHFSLTPPSPLKVDVICVSTFIVSKINLQWSCLPAFSHFPLQTISVLKFKNLDRVFAIFWFGILKILGFCVCENKSYIVVTIMTNHTNIFC